MSPFPPISPNSLNPVQKAAYDEISALHNKIFGPHPPYAIKDDTGALIGPFAPLLFVCLLLSPPLLLASLSLYPFAFSLSPLCPLPISPPPNPFANTIRYTPSLLPHTLALAGALTSLSLTPRERELVILATASTHHARYVLYAHSRLAALIGLSSSQISSASSGRMPEGLSSREEGVYGLALELAESKGPVGERVWERARWLIFGDREEEDGRKERGDWEWRKKKNEDMSEVLASVVNVVAGYGYTCLVVNAGEGWVPESREEGSRGQGKEVEGVE